MNVDRILRIHQDRVPPRQQCPTEETGGQPSVFQVEYIKYIESNALEHRRTD